MFSDKLKELRKSKGLTQKQFAKEISVVPGTVAMWETGRRMPEVETVKRLAKYFNVTIDELIDDTKNESTSSAKAYEMLYKKLVENGIIDKNKHLTTEEIDECLKKLGKIILAIKGSIY